MKPSDVLAQAREMRPGEYSDEMLLDMLRELEARIARETLRGLYVDYDDLPQCGELRAPAPYSAMYKWYVVAQIDLMNAEIERYNNDLTVFEELYTQYQKYAVRTYARAQRRNYKL